MVPAEDSDVAGAEASAAAVDDSAVAAYDSAAEDSAAESRAWAEGTEDLPGLVSDGAPAADRPAGPGGFGAGPGFGAGLQGTLTEIAHGQLTIQTADGQELVVAIDIATIFVRQSAIDAADVAAGDQVSVSLARGGFGPGAPDADDTSDVRVRRGYPRLADAGSRGRGRRALVPQPRAAHRHPDAHRSRHGGRSGGGPRRGCRRLPRQAL
jgi:hypothetical protein